MNLQQAYQGWQQQSQNRDLYVKTRDAFRKAWFQLPTNKPCSYYTKEVLGEALAATREIESVKAKAASVMIHVLAFANFAEPEVNPAPDFTFDELMEYTKGPLADPKKVASKRELDDDEGDDNDLNIDPVTAMPRRAMEQERDQESVDTIKLREKFKETEIKVRKLTDAIMNAPQDGHGDDNSDDPCAGISFEDNNNEEETKTEENMKKKNVRGRAPRPVAQIDTETLEVVKVWPTMGEAERETGACNLDRVSKLLRKSAGFYWCNADEVDTFKERLNEKLQKKGGRKKAKTKITVVKPTPFAQTVVPRNPTSPAVTQNESPDEPVRNSAQDALEVFTDEELWQELERRGWQGEISCVKRITIGKKEVQP
ncbi:MAG: hypothetical protein K6F74_05435 [Prevotella sp.]|nr:hypothetical protein [Prevotella sp.]